MPPRPRIRIATTKPISSWSLPTFLLRVAVRHHSSTSSTSSTSSASSTSTLSSTSISVTGTTTLGSESSSSASDPVTLLSTRARAQARIARIDSLSPSTSTSPSKVSPFLTDSFGRRHDYLRISLTEKCNLRCTYCMPESGVKLLPRDGLLTTDEIERTAKVFVANGVTKIRLTGGEPTVRKDLIDVVGKSVLAARDSVLNANRRSMGLLSCAARLGRLPLDSLGMTSNGIALKRRLPQLVEAGLTHLNLSLDTLDPFKYELMTRRRGFSAVMESLQVARGLASQGLRTKINVVVIRGLNDDEVPQFVELTKDMDITVRFIEYMPFEGESDKFTPYSCVVAHPQRIHYLASDNRWSTTKLVSSAQLVAKLQTFHPTLEKLIDPHSDTTRSWRVPGYRGKIGFISSMSDHFCGECSRLRIGADGRVKVCLFGPPVLSLRPLLRSPETTDQDLMQSVGGAVWGKKFAHNGLGGAEGISENGKMGPMVGIAFNPNHLSSQKPRQPLSMKVPTHLLPRSSPILPIFGGTRLFSSSIRHFRSNDSEDDSKPVDMLTHIDSRTGQASMVSVSSKAITLRSATAVGRIRLNEQAWSLIDFGHPSTESQQVDQSSPTMRTKKGDVLTIAHLAGLMATKQTSTLIPLCHPLLLSNIKLYLQPLSESTSIQVTCRVECEGKTGVEMEALMGCQVALLTVWDMCKAVAGKDMVIEGVKVVDKSGGRSGDWKTEE
ncbi:BQ2448_5307 [Microbotryum intermedium]|uniref:BQ2448_5307 protein n=1 Tax=Microbotryum intermedium TaxID=269621 RepID=A0A238F9E6_9BASI|nr:BQ2448_5307 [Microbotryum intermedium]